MSLRQRYPTFLLLFITFFSCANKRINILEFNKAVLKGKLKNGLTYYLQNPEKSVSGIEFRLVVKAGSMEEADNQRGGAHLLEHLAFRGTKDFPNDSIVHYLQSIGTPLGDGLNATTDFDQTIFKININQSDSQTIARCIHILSQWAYGISLDSAAIVSEKKIIADEQSWNNNSSLNEFPDTLVNTLRNGTLYAQRTPIGNSSDVNNLSPLLIRKFYKDWYRPNLMGIAVAGNFNKAYVQKLISKYFGSFKNPIRAPAKIDCQLQPFLVDKVIYNPDISINNYSFNLFFSSRKRTIPKTEKDLKKVIISSIALSLMQSHINLLNKKDFSGTETAKIIQSRVSNQQYSNFQLSLSPLDENDLSIKIKAFVQALAELYNRGINNAELQGAIQSFFTFNDAYLKANHSSNLQQLVDKMSNDYLETDYDMDPQVLHDETKKILSQIKIKDINDDIKDWLGNERFVALLRGSNNEQITPVNTIQLKDEIATAIHQNSEQPLSIVPYTKWMDSLNLRPGKIVDEQIDPVNKILTYHLSNGIIVYLDYGNNDSGNITFSATKLGGYEKYKVSDFENVSSCVNMVNAMGYGNYSYQTFSQILQSNKLNITHSVNANYYSVKGTSYNSNLQQLLETNAYMLLRPRTDTTVYNHYKEILINNKSKRNKFNYMDSIAHFFSKTNQYLKHKFDPSKLELNKSLKIYQDEFCNASGWHYSFCGNIDTTKFKCLIVKYLGGLPRINNIKYRQTVSILDLPPQGKFNIKLKDNNNTNGCILKYYYGKTQNSESCIVSIIFLKAILNERIFAELREKYHLIYYSKSLLEVNVNRFQPTYKYTLDIATNPKDIKKVNQLLNNLLKEISENGPTKSEFLPLKNKMLEFEKLKPPTNQQITEGIIREKFWGFKTSSRLKEAALKNISMKDIQSAANLIRKANLLTVTINEN